MKALSSNGFSHDMQVDDVLDYLRGTVAEGDYNNIIHKFPEVDKRILEGGWFDTDAMGVEAEWSMWVTDYIEESFEVFWWEGEPWVLEGDEVHPDNMDEEV
jgi:hypothetical protein